MFKLMYDNLNDCQNALLTEDSVSRNNKNELNQNDITVIEKLTFGSMALKKLLLDYSFETVLRKRTWRQFIKVREKIQEMTFFIHFFY